MRPQQVDMSNAPHSLHVCWTVLIVQISLQIPQLLIAESDMTWPCIQNPAELLYVEGKGSNIHIVKGDQLQ